MFCLLLFTSDYSKVVQAFADKKCDCFGELVRQGETKKAKNDSAGLGNGLFGGISVSMNLDSCAYTLLPANHRNYINNLDSVQLIQFYARVNQNLASNCKAAKKYKQGISR